MKLNQFVKALKKMPKDAQILWKAETPTEVELQLKWDSELGWIVLVVPKQK